MDNNEAIIVDVREPGEFASYKISNSHLCTLKSIRCEDLPKTDKKTLIYCQKGFRGTEACKKLLDEDGNLQVFNIEGGFEAWKNAGLPTEKGAKKLLPLGQQVQLTIGLFVFIFGVIVYFLNPLFALVAAFFGLGLINAGLTGWCGLANVMAKMPWNK